MAEWHVSDLKLMSDMISVKLPELGFVLVSMDLLLEVFHNLKRLLLEVHIFYNLQWPNGKFPILSSCLRWSASSFLK